MTVANTYTIDYQAQSSQQVSIFMNLLIIINKL